VLKTSRGIANGPEIRVRGRVDVKTAVMQFAASGAAQEGLAEGMHRLVSMGGGGGLSQCPGGLFLTASAHPPITVAEVGAHEEIHRVKKVHIAQSEIL
jgi:hypothetical protein